MPDNPYINHALAESAKTAILIINDPECNEAVTNTAQWANTAYDKLTANNTPAIHATSIIITIIHTTLMAKLLEPHIETP